MGKTRDRAIVALSLALLVFCLTWLARLAPNEAALVEQVLPPAQVEAVAELRRAWGDAGDFALVMIETTATNASDRLARTAAIEAELAHVPGVRRTWSALSRPRLTHEGGAFRLERAEARPDGDKRLAKFFLPDERTSLIVVSLDEDAATLTGARKVTRALGDLVRATTTPDTRVRAAGSPMLRVATWEAAAGDALRIVPVLVAISILVPLLFFRSFVAVIFPLVLGAFSATATFALHRVIVGVANPWMLVLLPIVWSVATMDAMHLYEAARQTGDVSVARKKLTLPCLLTAGTTAASLAIVAAPAGPVLFRSVGIWAAVGTLIAFALTFALAGPILRLASESAPLPKWPSRVALRAVLASARRPKLALAAWAVLVIGAAVFVPRLKVESPYPNVFAEGVGGTTNDDLRAVTRTTGAELAPLEIHLEALDDHSRRPDRLVAANLGLGEYLGTLKETRLVLSASTLVAEWIAREPGALGELQRQAFSSDGLGDQLRTAIGDARVASFIRTDRGSTRTLVLFAPATYERRAELFAWIEHYVRTVLPTYRVRLSGPAYLYHSAEREGITGVWQGAVLDVLLLVITFAIVFRRAGVALSAVVVNAAPIVVLLGLMALFRLPWRLGLMGLPIIVFGLAVDDTIHLLWPARSRPTATHLARSARHSAAAVMSTCALLAGSLGALAASGFQVNHELGMLLPLGLGLALGAELTLLPALLRVTASSTASTRR